MKRRYQNLHRAGKLLMAAAMLIGSTGCETEGADEAASMDVEEEEMPVQLGYSPYSTQFSKSGEVFYDLDFDNPVRKATGALYCDEYNNNTGKPIKTSDGNNVRVTCGITFVSPRYAITAAHCVDDMSCGGDGRTFKVRHFDIGDVYWRSVEEAVQLKVDGNNAEAAFEDGWQQNRYLNSDDGYEITFEDSKCEVVALCDKDGRYGRKNAQLCKVNGKEFVKDIALVFCPNRPISEYLEVARDSDVKVGKEVEAHWYHELLDVPPAYSGDDCKKIYRSSPNSTEARQCPSVVGHYNIYIPGAKSNNYHYIGYPSIRESQLFPLVTIPFKENGKSIKPKISDVSDNVTANVWGCHGMSGTGLLVKDSNGHRRLVGPTSTNTGYSKLGKRLCEKSTLSSGQSWEDPLLRYPLPKYSRALADWAKKEDLKVHYIVPPITAPLM